MTILDCADLIGKRKSDGYAEEYEDYINFFRVLGYATSPVVCRNVPRCWCPLVSYLGHRVETVVDYSAEVAWDSDYNDWQGFYASAKDKRRVVEVASTCRPELVHALYMADTEWPCPLRARTQEKAFLVTCNGSFFRDEVLAYQKKLGVFTPTKKWAVITPCAACKPYPAPVHQAVLDRIDQDRYHLICATGVLGLVPQELWSEMPHYDSGLPNLFRCQEITAWYFDKHHYDGVVIYSDFYAPAVKWGFEQTSNLVKTKFVFGWHYRDRYENLMLPESLRMLDRAIAEIEWTKDQ